MPAVTDLILLLLIFSVACVCSNVVIVTHNTTINLTCVTSGTRAGSWFANGAQVPTDGDRYRVSVTNGMYYTAVLTINGNLTSETVNIYCEVITTERQFVHMHNTTLRFEGRLPKPENVHIKEHFNSSTIEWNPPYSAMNNESDTIHVYPHITHYTVYITDNYTGDVVKVNVRETQYTPNIQQHNNSLCPMYQVSAWNAAGEGELSSPVWDSTPQVPLVENINVTVTAEPGVLQFHIEVGVVCPSRIPEFFLVTLVSGSETTRHHKRDFTISPPPNVDVCTILPRISAGNTVGTSPIETVVVVCSGNSTDSTVSSATTVSTVAGTESEREDRQQGITTTLIAIVIGVITPILGALIAIATVGYICYRKYKRRNSKDPSDKTDNFYSKSPSPYKPEVPEADYEQTTSRDPERARDQFTSSDSINSRSSDDPLLPPSPPVQAGKVIYAEVDPVKQTRVQPPAKEEPVFYSQIKH